jgi:crotonobetainyl-CoA:carnitine CoA-transferase CaiB-like acyl-CoA transferase
MSATPPRVERGAPLVGEHTREVLAEIGLDGARIDALIEAGAVAAHEPFHEVADS